MTLNFCLGLYKQMSTVTKLSSDRQFPKKTASKIAIDHLPAHLRIASNIQHPAHPNPNTDLSSH